MSAAPTLVDLLALSAGRHPAGDAVITPNERITFEALWSAVESGAAGLRGRGVSRGDRVALVAAPTVDTVAMYYAVFLAGAIVVPLDPQATDYELSGRITHCDPALVIVDSVESPMAAAATIVSAGRPVVHAPELLADQGTLIGEPKARPQVEDLAAIMYTSGTTARPKGVVLTHGNLAANTLAVIDYLGLGPTDRVLSPLPLFYAYGSSVLHTHLSAGASIVLSDMVFAERTVERMAAERVTGFSGVPWMFQMLMDRTSFPSHPLPALRYLTQAGARMAPAEIARLTAARPDVRLFVMYGQTEATARLTWLPPAELARRPGSVGRPIAGLRLEIRRPDGSAAAPNEPGEIVAAGPNIMRGYWRAPEATGETLASDNRGCWLRTGDRGYLDEDGYLYLDGRLSELIKVGGHRVSPIEVEEVARLLPGVAHAAAVGAPDGVLGEVVHLVIVRAPGSTVTAAHLVAHCRTHLSAYKVPRHVTFTDALPRTQSGKVQRHRLARRLEVLS